ERQAWLDRQVSTTDGMTGPEFERLVARLLVRDGHTRVQVAGGANDLGADVVGIDPAGRRVVVQCKRYTGHPVDSPAVQRFLGTVWQHHGADVGVIVTTSRFTAPAARLAARHGLHLVDRRRLAEWMAGTPPSPERS
ncbi:MAG TPA: restriction endonuclease, partial [Frankiaceae bacterium]|nr:restriction endonuclease [Frankiaceae bacterium]